MFMGMDGFEWFQGVVEDRLDPLKLGRVRVRCLGHHPIKKSSDQGIRTEELLWCFPMQSIQSAGMNGIGDAPVGVVEGTWVFGFFRDVGMRQDPVIMGTAGGIPEDAPNGSRGFNDPNAVYPKSAFLNEPDTNRLARNDVDSGDYSEASSKSNFDDGTTAYMYRPHKIIGIKRGMEQKDIPIAGYNADGGKYNEPPTPYAAKYPFNKVNESESGHIKEIDDTAGAERLHTYHRTGTFEEIHANGDRVVKIVSDDFEIVYKNKNLYVKGGVNITVDGDSTIYTKGDSTTQTDGNSFMHVKGNAKTHIEGTTLVTGDKTIQVNAKSNAIVNVDDTANINVTNDASIVVGKSASIKATDIEVDATNTMILKGGTSLSIEAPLLSCTGTATAIFTGGNVIVG